MLITTKNNRTVLLRKLQSSDLEKLLLYLGGLSEATKIRFGPHPFDKESVITFYSTALHIAYIAETTDTHEIIAYFIWKKGYLEHDSERLSSYGILLSRDTDCTFAPSVADNWQSAGIGKQLFCFMLAQLKATGIKRMLLWGGVQASNEKAVAYYEQLGFITLGHFAYNGLNLDMYYQISV